MILMLPSISIALKSLTHFVFDLGISPIRPSCGFLNLRNEDPAVQGL